MAEKQDKGLSCFPPLAARQSGSGLAQVEGVGKIAHGLAYTRQFLKFKSTRNELDDGRCIVGCAVHIALLGIGRNDDRGNTAAWAPTVSLGRRGVIPETAVLVVGDDDGHVLPLGAGLEFE